MSVAARITQSLNVAPEAWAIEFEGGRATWRDLSNAKASLTRIFDDAGIGADAWIGLLGANRIEPVAAMIAIVAAERGLLLLNPMRPAQVLAEEIGDLRLACIVGARQDWNAQNLAAAEAAGSMAVALDWSDQGLVAEILLPLRATDFRRRSGDTAVEMQTSGTTGSPKRIPLSARALAAGLAAGVRPAKREADNVLTLKSSPSLMYAPLVHTSGLFGVLLPVYECRPFILFKRFNAAELKRAMQRYRLRFLALPPTALRMVLEGDFSRADFDGVLAVRSGTAPLPVADQIAFEEKFGVPVLTNYGATEFMGYITAWSLEDYQKLGADKRGSVGKPIKGVALRVVDPANGSGMATGEIGVLEARVDRLGDKWLRTSDLASLDADGYLYIHGRSDDAIIRGGFKVLAGKVADALRAHESVADVIVIGAPDERLGQAPVAVIEKRPGTPADAEALKEFARTRLTAYEVPVDFIFVDALPRTISDKISRPDVLEIVTARRRERAHG